MLTSLKLHICGVTILGKTGSGKCKEAKMQTQSVQDGEQRLAHHHYEACETRALTVRCKYAW